MEKENKEIKKINLSDSELEKLDILNKVNQKVGRQLSIDIETGDLKDLDELKQLIDTDFENPQEKYQLYYKGIRKLLMDFLPKGKSNKQLRDLIYDEKNIFLNLGKKKSDNKGTRGSDGRMTFQPIMNEILEIIIDWISESQNPFDIYRKFYDLNEKHGYGHEEYDDSTKSFSKAMLAMNEK